MKFIEFGPNQCLNLDNVSFFEDKDGTLVVYMNDGEKVESILSYEQFKQIISAANKNSVEEKIAQLARYQSIPTP